MSEVKATPAAEATVAPGLKRAMGLGDLVLFYVVTGISLRWIATAAAGGPGSILIWGLAWLTFFLPPQSSATLTIFDWTCLVIIAGCVETIVVRLKRITAALQDKR